jgi:quinol monooxygenase YgiN
MEPIVVIVGYKPKPGKSEALRQLMREHLPTLHQQGLVTDRESIMMEAKDGTIIEVFEWQSKAAIDQAHTNPAVLAMWGKYAEACDYVPLGTIAEATDLFSSFAPFR